MNQLILSNKEITTNFSDCNSLSDVIKKVEKDGWDNGNVICGITLNGMKLTEEDENKFHASSVTEINQIEFQLNNISNVVDSTIASILEWFPSGIEGTMMTAELLRKGDELKAFEVFTQVVESCCWVSDSLNLLKSMCSEKIKAQSMTQTWDQSEIVLKQNIEALITSISTKDYQLTADLLEYELTKSLEDWSHILKQLV